MASLIAYTKGMLIERLRRHIADGFPNSSFTATESEVLLYIDQAAAFTVVGQIYGMAKVEGNLATPEGWLTTYTLSALTQNAPSGYWQATLPQPPVSLPLGYSINRVYAAQAGSGQSTDFLPIKAKRVGYRNLMPFPSGARYWVEGSTIWLAANDGSSLGAYTIYVQMIKTRTESLTETLNLPDDAIEGIFQNVVAKLIQRMQLPKDVIADDLPSASTNITK